MVNKLVLIGAIGLLVVGAFILGMQVYVACSYTNIYGEDYTKENSTNSTNNVWGDSYNEVALANASACLLFGLFFIFLLAGNENWKFICGMTLAVAGAGLAIASLVLTAIEADWVNTAVNINSTHPCQGSTAETRPSELECTNWLALEITVAVLSGLAFISVIFSFENGPVVTLVTRTIQHLKFRHCAAKNN